MKTYIALKLPFAIIGVLLAALAIFVFRPVLALVDASSSPSDLSTSTDLTATSSGDIASASTTPVTSVTESTSSAPDASAQGLPEVNIIGKKYVDYFTDGTTLTSFPGDPQIDSNLDKPNAPVPTHEGLTWVHTTGQYLYGTPSGDLEVGDYAVQADGSYIENPPPFVSSTSTPTQTTNDAAAPREGPSDASSTTSSNTSTTAALDVDSTSTTPAASATTPNAATTTTL
jgi:hypothetical protein